MNESMHIAFDVSYIQTRPHGYRRYAMELVRALIEYSEHHQWTLHGWSASLDARWIASLQRPGVKLSVLRLPGQVKRLYWNTLRVPPIESVLGTFDIFHSTDPLLPPTRMKSIITIHDLVYLKFPEWVERRVVRWGERVRKNVVLADAIVVVSSNTKRDVVELLRVPASKVHVVHPILSPAFSPLSAKQDKEVLGRYDLLQPYLLFVGTIEPRKNVQTLLEAYDRIPDSFRRQVKLVLVGRRGWKSGKVVRTILAHQRADRVVWLQNISDAELPALYRHALLVVYPSLYEGFGSPVAEALACGTPVITSNVASLPETAGQAAVFVDPTDPDALAEALALLINDESKRHQLRQLGLEHVRRFNPQHAVEKVFTLYRMLA